MNRVSGRIDNSASRNIADAIELSARPVSAKQYKELWRHIALLLDDELFGQDSRRMKAGTFAMLHKLTGIAHMPTPEECDGIQIRDVAESRRFFNEKLGFTETRIDDGCWKFMLGRNSIVCRLAPSLGKQGRVAHDYIFMQGKARLVPHCTVTLALQDWNALITRTRLCGLKLVKERNTFFVIDPSGNAVEFIVSNDRDVPASRSRGTRTAIKWGAAIIALVLLSAWFVLRAAN